MSKSYPDRASPSAWGAPVGAALRIAFGLVWAISAALTWTPEFANNFVGYLHNAMQGQPDWALWWYQMWIAIVTPQAGLFVFLTRLAETCLALALIFGFARKTVYILGALFSLLIWSTAEGFGGPYTAGAANMGAAIAYVLIFVALLVIAMRVGPNPYSVDYLIEKHWFGWRKVAEWRGDVGISDTRGRAGSATAVVTALVGLAFLAFFLLGGLYSSLNVQAPTPKAAAAAVSPLALASSEPLAKARDASLPPIPEGDEVNVHIVATDTTVEIASGVQYKAWTFGKSVPGPIIHVRQGQTVNIKFTNKGMMQHSVDFHTAMTAPSVNYVDIMPGETISFSFVAEVPGAFLYHCGTVPTLLHIGNGMYGAMIVSPKDPLPPADESYVIVQGEWYTRQVSGNLMAGDFDKMMDVEPDEVVFNGVAGQYNDHPLTAKVGDRVRFYMVNAGPNLWSAFHVIGEIFDEVYPDGVTAHALKGVSTYSVGPGEGVVMDVVVKEPGDYPFVDHSMAHASKGAHGILRVIDPNAKPGEEPKLNITSGSKTNAAGATTSSMAAGKQEAKAKAEPAGPYTFDPAVGKQLYANTCSACHQMGGTGLPGAFPPLKGNKAVLNDDPTKQIMTILHGLQGEAIDGVTYPTAMPPFGPSLSDTEIANIVNHERTSWGNKAKLITPDDVKKLRK